MISFTQDKSIHTWTGYLYAVLLLLVAFLQSVFLQQYFQRCFVLGMKVRTAIMVAVYKKVFVIESCFNSLLYLTNSFDGLIFWVNSFLWVPFRR